MKDRLSSPRQMNQKSYWERRLTTGQTFANFGQKNCLYLCHLKNLIFMKLNCEINLLNLEKNMLLIKCAHQICCPLHFPAIQFEIIFGILAILIRCFSVILVLLSQHHVKLPPFLVKSCRKLSAIASYCSCNLNFENGSNIFKNH